MSRYRRAELKEARVVNQHGSDFCDGAMTIEDELNFSGTGEVFSTMQQAIQESAGSYY